LSRRHPDKNANSNESNEKFKQINAAYARLTSAQDSDDDLDDIDLDDLFMDDLFAEVCCELHLVRTGTDQKQLKQDKLGISHLLHGLNSMCLQ
jgi:hypothetical protein